MPIFWIFLIVLGIATVGFLLARTRALASAGGSAKELHSLPSYYGWNAFLKSVVPAFGLMIIWLLAQPLYIDSVISGKIGEGEIREGSSRGLVLSEVRRTAEGLGQAVASGTMTDDDARDPNADVTEVTAQLKEAGAIVTSTFTQSILRAAQDFRAMSAMGRMLMTGAVILVALIGLFWSLRETTALFRARNVVEQGILAMLIGAASIAILTTIGIVLSLIFNTWEFFQLYPAWDFFFGVEWAPSFSGRGGASELGVLPLLWGTIYISIVALAVAVPIGLFAAIYLSEYASNRVRSFAKPMLSLIHISEPTRPY